jgi:hypothetical protein
MGKDSIDHPPRLHDDLANAVAGVSFLVSNAKSSHHEFNPALHISRQHLKLAVGNWPLFVGLSYGDNIVASVVGQTYNNEIRIFASFLSEGWSLRRHLLENVQSWLSAHPVSPRLSIMGAYEDNADVDIRSQTYSTVQEVLSGSWTTITRPWETRRDKMLDTLTKAQAYTFKPLVQFDPMNTRELSQALNSGRFSEKVLAEKKHYHIVNAFSLLIARLELWKAMPKDPKQPRLPPTFMSA